MRISKGDLVVMKGKKINNLYTLQGSMVISVVVFLIPKLISKTTKL